MVLDGLLCVNLLFEHDKFADLNLQSAVDARFGHRFFLKRKL
jgi:hypothetical protein